MKKFEVYHKGSSVAIMTHLQNLSNGVVHKQTCIIFWFSFTTSNLNLVASVLENERANQVYCMAARYYIERDCCSFKDDRVR